MRKYWKRLLCMALSLSLLGSVPAYAEITVVPPAPTGAVSDTGGQAGDNQPSGEGTSAGPDGGSSQTGNSGQTGNSSQTGNSGQTGTGQDGGPGTGTSEIRTVTEPVVQAQGAVLMDASTGTLIYSKNGETKYYPASITKLMTALLVAERGNLDDTVTFSKTAVTNLESGAVTLGLVEGDKLTVRQCMYGLLLKSANEVANGLAEHVSGSVSSFAALMNARAKELGCTNTNFVNPNGLNNVNHYTTPHDMARIARAAFDNQTVRKVASTLSYQIPATQKAGARTISLGHKMLYPNDSRYYEGAIGGKTGYTSLAGNTLVTCAERGGVRLVAVVMKSTSTQYTDTKALLDYGFALKNGSGAANKWEQAGSVWHFVKTDGSRAANEWLKIDGQDYWFDSDTSMAVGWRQFSNGSWYFFKPSGIMAANYWIESEGKWFYLGADGALYKNGKTPDGFFVDENGIWVK